MFTADQIAVEFVNDTLLVKGHSVEMAHSFIAQGPVVIHTFGELRFRVPPSIGKETVEELMTKLLCLPHRFHSYRSDLGDHSRVGINPFE